MEDEKILDLYFARDEQAIAETQRSYGRLCNSISRNILRNESDAEECVNDVWLGAWNSTPTQRPAPLRTYVCRIARNLATKKYHSKHAQKRNSSYDIALDELAECIPDNNTVEDSIEAKELAQIIDRFLDTLPYEDRFLFMRRYWFSDSLADAARMAGMSYNTAAVHLHRVKGKLKKTLLKEGVLV
jgi:RNA polymerase sigma-70 factor (ECF subfamily)